MTTASALYEGWVRHRRREPVRHEFRYRVSLAWLDLAELDTVFAGRWLCSTRAPAPLGFRRAHHFGDPTRPLAGEVRDRVERETGLRPQGPIRLLTQLAWFGWVFNPVSFFYCYDPSGGSVEAVVAEIDNTPWGERHLYVLPARASVATGRHALRWRFAKAFHVSPFMAMAQSYDWRFSTPGRQLVVHMNNLESDRSLFDATLVLERREITTASLAGTALRHPLQPVTVLAAIYLQAARLALKGAPFHTHPDKIQGKVTT